MSFMRGRKADVESWDVEVDRERVEVFIRVRSLRRRRGDEDVRWCWAWDVMAWSRRWVFDGGEGARSWGGGGASCSSSVSDAGSAAAAAAASSRSVCADFQGWRGNSSCSGEGDGGLGVMSEAMSAIVGIGGDCFGSGEAGSWNWGAVEPTLTISSRTEKSTSTRRW